MASTDLAKEFAQIREEILKIQGELVEIQKKAREEESNEIQEREKQEREERERLEKEELEREEKERVERERLESEQKEREEKERLEKERVESERREREEREREEKAKQASAQASQSAPQASDDKYEAERRRLQEEEKAAIFGGARQRDFEKPKFQHFGIDQDLQKRAQDKYSPQLEKEAIDWITAVTGESQQGSFAEWLRSGIVLCNLINKLKPGTIKKVNKMKAPFMQMENINNFLNACKAFGVPESDVFMTVDLYEEKNMNQVVQGIHSLGRVARRIPGYSGPALGAKLADRREVNFTDEQLKRGQYELNFTQQNQSDSQKTVSEMRKPGLDSVIRSKDTGTTTSEPSLFDRDKGEAQREANTARRQKHNIIH